VGAFSPFRMENKKIAVNSILRHADNIKSQDAGGWSCCEVNLEDRYCNVIATGCSL